MQSIIFKINIFFNVVIAEYSRRFYYLIRSASLSISAYGRCHLRLITL